MTARLYFVATQGGPMGKPLVAAFFINMLVVTAAVALAVRYSKSRK